MITIYGGGGEPFRKIENVFDIVIVGDIVIIINEMLLEDGFAAATGAGRLLRLRGGCVRLADGGVAPAARRVVVQRRGRRRRQRRG